jgi:hypothetical protein
MLLRQRNSEALEALAESLREVARELRLVDLADFVTFIRGEQFANIQDVVNSSTELFFKHGTLTYGSMASYELEWDHPPTVTICLEFNHSSVSILFDLVLQTFDAGVEIRAISLGDELIDPDEETKRIVAAIAAARLSGSQSSQQY